MRPHTKTMSTAAEERIERLESRVDKIEDRISVNLQRIFESLEELKIGAAKHACPAPGSCITLGEKLQETFRAHTATMLRVERLELRILEMDRSTTNEFHKLEKQKMWILGAWSVIALAASVVGGVAVIAVNIWLKK